MTITADAQMGPTFFFLDELDTLDAIVGRIVPGNQDDPGAREAGVVTYIDRALSGAYADYQLHYREGLRALDVYVDENHGEKFFELSDSDQDAIITKLEQGAISNIDATGGREFFLMVWAHTIEGLFCDPAYGGNKDAVGWKLIGFPGAQFGYSAEEMQYGADHSAKPVMTLADIRRLARDDPDRFYQRRGPKAVITLQQIPEMPPAESTGEAPTMHGAS
jgi:gluconate 2-dehydrogenase gamma chain